MQINNTNLALLYRGFNVLFQQGLDQDTPVSNAFTLELPSSSKIEEYDWLNAVPGMKELKDEIETSNLSASQWTIANKEWYDLVAVKQWDIESDKYGIYNPLMSNMGVAATMHKDELVFPLLNNGFSTTDYTGSNFFAANKKRSPNDKGFTNILVTGGNVQANAPLSLFSYQAAKANILSRRNSANRPMNLGKKLLLVVDPSNEDIAKNIVKTDLIIQAVRNAGGDVVAAANTNNIQKNTAEVLSSVYVTPGYWFLLEVGKPVKPVGWQLNKKPVLLAQTSEAQSDHVFEKHEFLRLRLGYRGQAFEAGHRLDAQGLSGRNCRLPIGEGPRSLQGDSRPEKDDVHSRPEVPAGRCGSRQQIAQPPRRPGRVDEIQAARRRPPREARALHRRIPGDTRPE
jgi:phage major head subunit gpT-like protein